MHLLQGGGTFVQSLRKSYSLSDLSEPDTGVQSMTSSREEVMIVERRPGGRTMRQRPQSLRSYSSAGGGGANDLDMNFDGALDRRSGKRVTDGYR